MFYKIKKGELSFQTIIMLTIGVVVLAIIILFISQQTETGNSLIDRLKDLLFSARR
jgi:hypothetical protein